MSVSEESYYTTSDYDLSAQDSPCPSSLDPAPDISTNPHAEPVHEGTTRSPSPRQTNPSQPGHGGTTYMGYSFDHPEGHFDASSSHFVPPFHEVPSTSAPQPSSSGLLQYLWTPQDSYIPALGFPNYYFVPTFHETPTTSDPQPSGISHPRYLWAPQDSYISTPDFSYYRPVVREPLFASYARTHPHYGQTAREDVIASYTPVPGIPQESPTGSEAFITLLHMKPDSNEPLTFGPLPKDLLHRFSLRCRTILNASPHTLVIDLGSRPNNKVHPQTLSYMVRKFTSWYHLPLDSRPPGFRKTPNLSFIDVLHIHHACIVLAVPRCLNQLEEYIFGYIHQFPLTRYEIQQIWTLFNRDSALVRKMINSTEFHQRRRTAGQWTEVNRFIWSEPELQRRYVQRAQFLSTRGRRWAADAAGRREGST